MPNQFLQKHTTEALPLPAGKKVIVVPHDISAAEGFQYLVKNNILSAPVYNATTKKYHGFLDMHDIVSFVVLEADLVKEHQKKDAFNFIEAFSKFGTKMFKNPLDGMTVTYLASRRPFSPVKVTDSLWEVALKLKGGAHRVPVVNADGLCVNIISQSTFIHFMNEHIKSFKGMNADIDDLKIGTFPVYSVQYDAPIIEAFKIMDIHAISGLAIINEHKKLIGNMSGSDIKLFVNNPSVSLSMSVMDYIAAIRQQSLKATFPAMRVDPHSTLSHIIGKLAATRVHRLFETDKNEQVTRVVSVTDILKHVLTVAE